LLFAQAKTMVFLCLCFAENLRPYTIRSFYNPIWVNMFSNKWLLLGKSGRRGVQSLCRASCVPWLPICPFLVV